MGRCNTLQASKSQWGNQKKYGKLSIMQVTKHNSVTNFPTALLSGSLAAHLQGTLWKSRIAS